MRHGFSQRHERVTQELKGHADNRTTREICTHTTKRMMDAAIMAAANALDEVLGEAARSPIGSPDSSKNAQRKRRRVGKVADMLVRVARREGFEPPTF